MPVDPPSCDRFFTSQCHAFNWGDICPDDSLYSRRKCPPKLPIVQISFQCYAELDADFQIVSEVRAVVPQDLKMDKLLAHYKGASRLRNHAYGLGYTDARLCDWDGAVYMVLHGLPSRHDIASGSYMKRMYIRQLWPVLTTAVQLHSTTLDITDDAPEKNWSPVGTVLNSHTSQSDMLLARYVEPHQIVQCSRAGECVQAAVTSRRRFFAALKEKWSLTSIHLGTNAVRVNDTYHGAIFHGLRKSSGNRHYFNFAYMFLARPPYTIARVANRPLTLPRTANGDAFRFCFTTGLTYVDGRLVVSYGYNDNESMFYITTAEELFADMKVTLEHEAE